MNMTAKKFMFYVLHILVFLLGCFLLYYSFVFAQDMPHYKSEAGIILVLVILCSATGTFLIVNSLGMTEKVVEKLSKAIEFLKESYRND